MNTLKKIKKGSDYLVDQTEKKLKIADNCGGIVRKGELTYKRLGNFKRRHPLFVLK